MLSNAIGQKELVVLQNEPLPAMVLNEKCVQN
jgi:hypothetical protein